VLHIREWVGGQMGWADGVDSGLRLPFRHNGTSCCAKGAINGLQTTLQGRAGLPLLKPTKHCYSVFRALQGHEKAICKSRPGYLFLFYCGVWIVHEYSYKVSQ